MSSEPFPISDLDYFFDGLVDPKARETVTLERLDRYQTIMRHEFDRLSLTDGERGLIEEIITATPRSIGTILSLDSELIDAMRSRRLVKKWRVEPNRLAAKLREMTPAQKCSIIEAFERGHLRTRGRTDQLESW